MRILIACLFLLGCEKKIPDEISTNPDLFNKVEDIVVHTMEMREPIDTPNVGGEWVMVKSRPSSTKRPVAPPIKRETHKKHEPFAKLKARIKENKAKRKKRFTRHR